MPLRYSPDETITPPLSLIANFKPVFPQVKKILSEVGGDELVAFVRTHIDHKKLNGMSEHQLKALAKASPLFFLPQRPAILIVIAERVLSTHAGVGVIDPLLKIYEKLNPSNELLASLVGLAESKGRFGLETLITALPQLEVKPRRINTYIEVLAKFGEYPLQILVAAEALYSERSSREGEAPRAAILAASGGGDASPYCRDDERKFDAIAECILSGDVRMIHIFLNMRSLIHETFSLEKIPNLRSAISALESKPGGEESLKKLVDLDPAYRATLTAIRDLRRMLNILGTDLLVCFMQLKAEGLIHEENKHVVETMYAPRFGSFPCNEKLIRELIACTGDAERLALIEELQSMRRRMISSAGLTQADRRHRHYLWLLKTVFPKGNFGSHEENSAACADKGSDLKKFKFNREGYPAQLTGVVGYSLREGEHEDLTKLKRYTERIEKIRSFIEHRKPQHAELQKAFSIKIAELAKRHALRFFANVQKYFLAGQLLCILLSELLQKRGRRRRLNSDILDLLVEYRFVCVEDVETFVQRSADAVRRETSDTAKHRTLWLELANIYGEHVDHIIRHELLSDEMQRSEEGIEILIAANVHLGAPPDDDPTAIDTNLMQRALEAENRTDALLNLEPAIAAGINFKKRKVDREIVDERAEFHARFEAAVNAFAARDFSPEACAELIESLEALRQEFLHKKIAHSFENPHITDKFAAVRQQVLKIFGSNIDFVPGEKESFEKAIDAAMEQLRNKCTFSQFLRITPALRGIRQLHRFHLVREISNIFDHDRKNILHELGKYCEILDVEIKKIDPVTNETKTIVKSAQPRHVRSFFTKTKETSHARMGAHLCIAGDTGMWKHRNYFELVTQDEDTQKCVGVVMLVSITTADKKRYLWFGPNPYESFLGNVSASACYQYYYDTVTQFARENGFDGVVIPQEHAIVGMCTNRAGEFADCIRRSILRGPDGKAKSVSFGKNVQLSGKEYTFSDGVLIWQRS